MAFSRRAYNVAATRDGDESPAVFAVAARKTGDESAAPVVNTTETAAAFLKGSGKGSAGTNGIGLFSAGDIVQITEFSDADVPTGVFTYVVSAVADNGDYTLVKSKTAAS